MYVIVILSLLNNWVSRMPITIEHLEDHIIVARWCGVIRLEEVFEAGKETLAVGNAHGYDHYVQIIDGREVERIPFEMRMLSKVVLNDRLVSHYVILGAPTWTQTITRIVQIITRVQFEHFNTYEVAIERAREVRDKIIQVS